MPRHALGLLLAGQVTSQFGAQVSAVALPLLAVLTLDAGPFEVGVLSASSTIAFTLIGLPAGAWVDRLPRRPVLVTADLVRAVLLATIPLAAVTGLLTVAQLALVALLTGFARVFFDVAYQSYLPTVVGKDRVLTGNSLMETVRAGGQFAGPGLGGWLVSLVGAAPVVLVQSFTFVVSALCLLGIRAAETPDPARPRRLWPDVAEGLSFVRGNRFLVALASASALSNFAFAVASAVTIVFMARTLQMSATVIGLVVAAGAVAAMAGAALTPWLSTVVGSARVVWVALVVAGPLTMVAPLARPGPVGVALVAVSIAGGELGQIVYAVSSVSLRQRMCPDRLLGRVNATMRFLIMAAFPLGGLLGGLLGSLLGLRATLAVVGVLFLLAPLPVRRVLRGTRDVEELEPWW